MGLPTALSIVRDFKYNKNEKTSNQTTLPQVQGLQEEMFLISSEIYLHCCLASDTF